MRPGPIAVLSCRARPTRHAYRPAWRTTALESIVVDGEQIVVGVDTHKWEHVAVAVNGLGRRLHELTIPATPAGYQAMLEWAQRTGPVAAFGIEGTGSYGSGLARFLGRMGHLIIEVSRPPRKGERRLNGKSDPIDAEHAARAVLAGKATATPKLGEGAVETIRLVKIARDSAVRSQSQAMITLKAVLVTAPDELRQQLEGLSDFKLVITCASLVGSCGTDPCGAVRHVLKVLARRWLQLHEEVESHTRALKDLTKQVAPGLVAAFGIGPVIAAELLVTAGSSRSRIHSEAAFAKLCGACPVPASSGAVKRHRLNRGGNRQANAALYRAIVVRLRWHAPTVAYVQRRTAQGLSKREAIRCLKRFLVREVYRLMPSTAPTAILAVQAA
jgi:transposase